MEITLISPPIFSDMATGGPPLGVATLTTALKEQGVKVEPFDLAPRVRYHNRRVWGRKKFNIEIFEDRKRVLGYLQGSDPLIKKEIRKILSLIPEIMENVGISTVTDHNLAITLCMGKYLHEKDRTVFLGGSALKHAHIREIGFDFIDYVEVEKAPDFLKYLGFDSKQGLENESIPEFNLEDIGYYKALNTKKRRVLPYRISEGCCNMCAFCNERYRGSYKYKSIEKIVCELNILKKKYKTRYFYFCDSNINNDNQYIEELCDSIVRERLDIEWGGLSRIDIPPEVMKKMRKAGCRFLMLGIESGSDRMLSLINKRTSTSLISKNLRLLKKYGIKAHCFFIAGLPHESEEDFIKTLEFIEKNREYMNTAACSPFMLVEGSLYFKYPKRFGIELIPMKNSLENLLFIHSWAFNEKGGLSWREKSKQISERELKIKYYIMANIIKRNLREKPLEAIKTKLKESALKTYQDWGNYF